jgi:hypothetical protein
MGDRAVIDQVTSALVGYMQSRLPDLGTVQVHSLSAGETPLPSSSVVIALAAVDAHEHMRSLPLVETGDGFERPPLRLRLSYVVTFTGDHAEAQTRLASVLALFHTTPILHTAELTPALGAKLGTLTVQLRNTTADERNHIWTAWGREARLALYYTVDVALIDLLDDAEGWGTVTQHRVNYVGSP